MSVSELTLNNWAYREAGTTEWKPSKEGAAITQIHVDLLANNEIPDPFMDLNEKEVQWVGERDWEYKATFKKPTAKSAKHELVFEGLDTFATVYLNEEEILKTDNYFVQYTADITSKIKDENTLRIYFEAALAKGRQVEKEKFKAVLFNGETSRVQVRKPQYHYGWDWGPVLMTCGPSQPVKLVSYNSIITDVYAKAEVTEKLEASFDVQVEVTKGSDVSVEVEIVAPDGGKVGTKKVEVTGDVVSVPFALKDPQLWYPNGLGEQPLYEVTVKLVENGNVIQTISKQVGVRRVELVQEPLDGEPGTSFYFRVNNVPVYSVGSNWIPAHSFSTLVTDKDYTDWLQIAIDGNQNMIRVWGGGYYETEVFYAECDRLGLMVWQDFMFACGQYPGDKQFLASVTAETKHQLRRLRNHCSLTVYAGNNEDYQVAEQFNLEWNPEEILDDYSHTNFPARTIYEITLPNLVSELTPSVPYHPGSPWGGNGTPDMTIGDVHQWNVWHGSQEPYQDWYRLGGRFISEFGMEALPSRKTYEACITDKTELYPQSETVNHHNKADGFERRLALYVMENIKVTSMDLDSWIYATQLMQAECLAYAYRCWRRQWKGDGKRYTSGAIVWQINDCWPVASWAIVDYFKRPKLSFYAVKRESGQLGLGLFRNVVKATHEQAGPISSNGPPHDYSKVSYNVDIWGVNSKTTDQAGVLKVDIYEVASGKLIKSLPDQDVILKANQSTQFVTALSIPNDTHVVVFARLSVDGKVIFRAGDWPQPLKFLKFPGREVKYEVQDGQIKLSANKPVKGVEILVERDDVFLQDNGVDIFPGDEQVIIARNIKKGDSISLRYYQQE